MSEICTDFIEHKEWRQKHPTGPVTWDAWCSSCGFKLEDKPFADGGACAIKGDGRTLARCYSVIEYGGQTFKSNSEFMYCSKCAPAIEKGEHAP